MSELSGNSPLEIEMGWAVAQPILFARDLGEVRRPMPEKKRDAKDGQASWSAKFRRTTRGGWRPDVMVSSSAVRRLENSRGE